MYDAPKPSHYDWEAIVSSDFFADLFSWMICSRLGLEPRNQLQPLVLKLLHVWDLEAMPNTVFSGRFRVKDGFGAVSIESVMAMITLIDIEDDDKLQWQSLNDGEICLTNNPSTVLVRYLDQIYQINWQVDGSLRINGTEYE